MFVSSVLASAFFVSLSTADFADYGNTKPSLAPFRMDTNFYSRFPLTFPISTIPSSSLPKSVHKLLFHNATSQNILTLHSQIAPVTYSPLFSHTNHFTFSISLNFHPFLRLIHRSFDYQSANFFNSKKAIHSNRYLCTTRIQQIVSFQIPNTY